MEKPEDPSGEKKGWQASFLEPMMKEYVDAAKFCGQNGWRKELGHDKQNLSQLFTMRGVQRGPLCDSP